MKIALVIGALIASVVSVIYSGAVFFIFFPILFMYFSYKHFNKENSIRINKSHNPTNEHHSYSLINREKGFVSKDAIEELVINIVGVSKDNTSGLSRQEIISMLTVKSKLQAVKDTQNKFHDNAIKIMSDLGCVGFISRDLADKFTSTRKEITDVSFISKGKTSNNIWGCKVKLQLKDIVEIEDEATLLRENNISFPLDIKMKFTNKSDNFDCVDEIWMQSIYSGLLSQINFAKSQKNYSKNPCRYRLVREPDNQRSLHMVKLYVDSFELGEVTDSLKPVISAMLDSGEDLIVTDLTTIPVASQKNNFELIITVNKFTKPKRELSKNYALEHNMSKPDISKIDEERFWFGLFNGWNILDTEAFKNQNGSNHVWYTIKMNEGKFDVSFDLTTSKGISFKTHTPYSNKFMQRYKSDSEKIWKYFCENYEDIVHQLAIYKLIKETPFELVAYPLTIHGDDFELIDELYVSREEQEFPPIQKKFHNFHYFFRKYTQYLDGVRQKEMKAISFSEYLDDIHSKRRRYSS